MRNSFFAAIAVSCILAGCGGDSGREAGIAQTRLLAAANTAPREVLVPGLRADYGVTRSGTTVTVQRLDASEAPLVFQDPQRIAFADESLAFDFDGTAGMTYRIYQAAFNRTPDLAGLSYWIGVMDGGTSLETISGGFMNSDEFKAMYGAAPSNAELVDRFYRNVLHRAPEQAGYDFWLGILDRNAASRAQVLAGFGESQENKAGVAPAIAAGIRYVPYPSRIPSNAQALALLSSSTWIENTDDGLIVLRIGANGEYLSGDPYPPDAYGTPGIEYGTLSVTTTDTYGYALQVRPQIDTNGFRGLSHLAPCVRLQVTDAGLRGGDVGALGCTEDMTLLKRAPFTTGIFGVWVLDPTRIRTPLFVFYGNGKFATIDPIGDTAPSSCGGPGYEAGTYFFNPATKMLRLTSVSVNTDGCAGLAENGLEPGGPMPFIVNSDGNTATLGGTTIYRIK